MKQSYSILSYLSFKFLRINTLINSSLKQSFLHLINPYLYGKPIYFFISSTIVGETRLKFFACEENAAFDSSERKVHFLSDFIVLIARYVH